MARQSVIESVVIGGKTVDIVKSNHFNEQYYTRVKNKPTVDLDVAIQKIKEALPTIIVEWGNKGIAELSGVIQSISTELNVLYVLSKNTQTNNIDLVLITVVQKPINQFWTKEPTDYKVKVSSRKKHLVDNIYASKLATGIFTTNKLLQYLVHRHIVAETFPDIGIYVCGDENILYVVDKKPNRVEIMTAIFTLSNNIFIQELP